ncbi:MAG: ATP-binding protein [Thermodesulfobacteriota bacterium]
MCIGVEPTGRLCGIELGKGTLEDLANKIAQGTSPRVTPSISSVKRDRKTIVVVSVPESTPKPVYAFDRPYRRAGKTNQRLSQDDAMRLFMSSRGVTWDQSTLTDATVEEDIDPALVQRFLLAARSERRWDVPDETTVDRVLRQLGLMQDGKLTEEKWEYPLEGLREAAVNAICHRDYTSSANVQVRIFDDRLEVWNPGDLPEGMTVEDLRRPHESKPRNKLIANAFFLIKYIEQFGTGIQRILDDCRAQELPAPTFEAKGHSFRAIFTPSKTASKVPAVLELTERQKRLVAAVKQKGRITRSEYEKLTGVSRATAKRDLENPSQIARLRSTSSHLPSRRNPATPTRCHWIPALCLAAAGRRSRCFFGE